MVVWPAKRPAIRWADLGDRWDDLVIRWADLGDRWDDLVIRWADLGDRWDDLVIRWDNLVIRWDDLARQTSVWGRGAQVVRSCTYTLHTTLELYQLIRLQCWWLERMFHGNCYVGKTLCLTISQYK